MKALNLLLITCSMAGILTWAGCKEEPPCNDPTNPDCANYDPCYGKKPVTADFEMSQGWTIVPPRQVEEWIPDVAFRRGLIGFKPVGYDEKDTTVKYTWLLGSEVIHEYHFERSFIDTKEREIPITLIVEKKPDLSCFPEDDGKDTLTKLIKLVDRSCDFLTNGDFKVLFEGEKDSVIIKFRNWDAQGPIASWPRPYEIIDTCAPWNMAFMGLRRDHVQPDTCPSTLNVIQFNSRIYTLSAGGEGNPRGNPLLVVNPETLAVYGQYTIKNAEDKIYKFKGRKIR